MSVGVDGAGHDDATFDVVVCVGLGVWLCRYDFAVLDIDVADLATHFICGIIDFSAGKLDEHSRETPDLECGFDGREHVGRKRKLGAAEILKRQRHDNIDPGHPTAAVTPPRAGGNET